jgi:hypothetical protein
MARWTAKSGEQLLAELHDPPLAYQAEVGSKTFNSEGPRSTLSPRYQFTRFIPGT